METKAEALEGSTKKLTITLSAEEVDARIAKQYKDFANRYNFPGFRKGRAPRPVIDNMLGKEAVVATVTENAMNECYPLAVEEHDLVTMGQPSFDEPDAMVRAHEEFTFAVTVECRPELELSSYEPVEVKLPGEQATDEEVDGQIDELRNYYYTFEDEAEGAVLEQGSFAELAMKATDPEGAEIDALSSESRLYEVGGGILPAGFDDQIEGMKAGESRTFDVDMTQPSVLGRNVQADAVTFEVEVKQVKRKVLPELTDEWARETAGFEGGVAEMREKVGEQISQQKQAALPRMRENEALYAIQERLQGEAPKGLIDAEEANLLQSFFMQMQQSGMSFDMYLAQMGMTPDRFRDDVKRQAADVTKQDLALDAWARHAGIEISAEDVAAEFANSGSDDPAALQEEWRVNGRLPMLRAGMRRARALEQIVEGMVVTELAPGEKLNSAKFVEAEQEAAEADAAEADDTDEAPRGKHAAPAADDGKLTASALNKLKVAELREKAADLGIAADGLKKAELVEAILAAE